MTKWEIDVAVLCIFFARPEQFRQSFAAVKKAKPKILLLWQDGPRNENDMDKILECRRIAEDIDWDCTVYKNYHEKNMGCDPSTFLSHKWAFSIVDKCIILEDDVIPAQSFFPFCKELLDKYENDTRIGRICGQTLFDGVPDKRYSYFFARSGSSWGWASWRRVAERWEDDYRFIQDDYYINLARHRFGHKRFEKSLSIAMKRAQEKIPYWEHIIGFETTLNSELVIYPTYNMISSVGASCNATHAPNNISELPKDVQECFKEDLHEIEFPLKHPPYIIEDYHYFYKLMDFLEPSLIRKVRRKIEHLFRLFWYRLVKRRK